MEIKQFVFNPFGVNCYILSNSKGEAILIDPSVSNAREQAALTDYLKSENLKVVRVLNTHLHLDHVLGNAFAERTFGVKAEAHKDKSIHNINSNFFIQKILLPIIQQQQNRKIHTIRVLLFIDYTTMPLQFHENKHKKL